MKTEKKQRSKILCVLLLLSFMTVGFCQPTQNRVFAAEAIDFGTCGENLMWYLDTDGLLTIYGTGEMEQHSDQHRPRWMQYADSVRALTVEEGITNITALAFNGCHALADVSIPDSLEKIHGTAFENTAFYNDESNYEDGVLYLGTHLLKAKADLASAYEIKAGTKSVADNAFFGCNMLTEVSIPDTVRFIGTNAFYGCTSLSSVSLPDTEIFIEPYAFADTALYADEGNWENGSLYVGSHLILVRTDAADAYTVKAGTRSVACNAFENCSALTQITVADTVGTIGTNAFNNCRSVTQITLPSQLTRLNDSVFMNCRQLQEITLPDTLTYIGNHAFAYCTALQTVHVPAAVTEIGEGAFSYCSALTGIETDVENTAFTCVNGVLYNKNMTTLLAYPQGKTERQFILDRQTDHIAPYAFSDCTALQTVTLPDGFLRIGAYAFNGCSGMTAVTLPDSILQVGKSAFMGCTKLTCINIPDRITKIEPSAFADCTSLAQITFGNGLTAVGDGAFSGCTALESLVIPQNVTDIGTSAFRACSALTAVTLPDSVQNVGIYAFANCSELKDLYFLGTRTAWTRISEASRDIVMPFTTVHCNYKGDINFTNSARLFINSDSILIALHATDVHSVLQNAGGGAKVFDATGTEKEPSKPVATGDVLQTADEMQVPAVVIGDVDGDAAVSPADARLALRRAVGLETFDDVRTAAADTDGDCKISVADARNLLRAGVGLDEPDNWFASFASF